VPKLVPTLILAVALGAAACAGGSGAKPPAGGSVSTSTTLGAPAADVAFARRIGLTLADFPAGWSEQPRSDDIHDAAATRQLRKCLHLNGPPARRPLATAESPDFRSRDGASVVWSHVGVALHPDRITRGMNLIAGSGVASCLAEGLDTVYARDVKLPTGTRVGKVVVRRESYPATGDRTIAYQVEVPVSVGNRSVNVYVDVIVVQQGRIDIILTDTDVYAPLPIETSRALLRRMLARAAAA